MSEVIFNVIILLILFGLAVLCIVGQSGSRPSFMSCQEFSRKNKNHLGYQPEKPIGKRKTPPKKP